MLVTDSDNEGEVEDERDVVTVTDKEKLRVPDIELVSVTDTMLCL